MTAAIFSAFPGRLAGRFNFWGISDRGTDNLGHGPVQRPARARRQLSLSDFFDQHRQDLGEGFTFTAELGKISDRNFLQEYFQQEWDELKDPTTDVDLKFRREDFSMSLLAAGAAGQLRHRDAVAAAFRSLPAGRIVRGQPADVVRAHEPGLCPVQGGHAAQRRGGRRGR